MVHAWCTFRERVGSTQGARKENERCAVCTEILWTPRGVRQGRETLEGLTDACSELFPRP